MTIIHICFQEEKLEAADMQKEREVGNIQKIGGKMAKPLMRDIWIRHRSNSLQENWRRKQEAKKANPHKLRRTCATMALRRGMPIEQVSKMLGHENISTTQIYLDLQEEELAIAHKKYVI